MNLLFFTSKRDRVAERLQKVIEVLVPQERLEIYRTLGSLSRRLHQPRNDLNIAVLAASSKEELMDILSLRNLLSDIRIILILPDRESDTNSKAHTLGPRFLSYADSDFEEVKIVLGKMLESLNSRQIQRKGVIQISTKPAEC